MRDESNESVLTICLTARRWLEASAACLVSGSKVFGVLAVYRARGSFVPCPERSPAPCSAFPKRFPFIFRFLFTRTCRLRAKYCMIGEAALAHICRERGRLKPGTLEFKALTPGLISAPANCQRGFTFV